MANLPENINGRKRREENKLPYFVLIVSLIITFGASYFFYQNSKIRDDIRFLTEVSKNKTIIENNLSDYISMLRSVRAYIESNQKISKKDFALFIKNLEVDSDYKGMQGVGFVKSVSFADRNELVRRLNSEGYPNFRIFPENASSEAANSYVVVYFEPSLAGNQSHIGFDMAADDVRLEALTEARNSGRPAVSGKVTLLHESRSEPNTGFLISLPFYKSGDIPSSPEERRRLLDGFVYSPLSAKEFLDDVRKSSASNYLAISVFDGEKTPANLLAQTGSETDSLHITTIEIQVANKKWIVEYKSLPDFEAQSTINLTSLVFIAGLTFSVLLFGITYVETFARLNSERTAANLRKSENEKARLLESEQKARAAAEKANHAKDEFIANVSHELRTPLNSIAGWSRILQADDVTPALKAKALQTIDKSLRAQTKIIEDLLDFSQINSSKQPAGRQDIRFSDVFEEAFTEVESSAAKKKIAFEKINSLNGQTVCGDHPHLKKVIKNLLSNAVKFTPEGGRITAEARENQDMLELKVRDNGQGIDTSFLPHIFDQFKQADSSTTRRHGGLGMGLAISRQIIESYGGQIKADSEGEGKGALFTVQLPFSHKHNEKA